MKILLDPLLLAPPVESSGVLPWNAEFWRNVVDWAADTRAGFGRECHGLVCDAYAQYGYPDQDLEFAEASLKREYQGALTRLLSRLIPSTDECGSREFRPGYLGADIYALALQMDVSSCSSSIGAIGTLSRYWQEAAPSVEVIPPPPMELALCFDAGVELPAEARAVIARFYKSRRIHLVGGKRDQRVVAEITLGTGVPEDQIVWIECERARPPRNLDARWRHLDADVDVTVCITGRVGHATSENAARAAGKSKVAHLKVETAGEIVRALIDHTSNG